MWSLRSSGHVMLSHDFELREEEVGEKGDGHEAEREPKVGDIE